MERNFYDMTKVSGKAVNDAKRIQAQTADYLAKHNAQLQESLQAEEDKKMNAAMSGARFGYAANVARSNARINKLNEEIRYTNESSVIGMTEMVAQVVEAGLLLDESELVKIYPEYKEDIRGIVKGFLKEGELNSVITKDETLQLMEYVSKRLPGVREGVTLTEDELSNYMAINKPLDIDKSIRNLGGDVATRVATLMEKEQKKAEQIEKDVKRAKAKEAKMAANDEVPAEELIAALENGEISEDDLAEMLQNGEISQNTYDEVVGAYEEQAAAAQDPNAVEMDPAMQGQTPVTTSAEAPAEEDPAMAGGDPAMMGQDPNVMGAEAGMEDPNAAGMDPAMAGGDPAMMGQDPNVMGGAPASVAPGMPKKQIQMLPDGSMNINIYESLLLESMKHPFLTRAINNADDKDINKILVKLYKRDNFKKAVNMSLEKLLKLSLEKKKAIVMTVYKLGKENKKAKKEIDSAEEKLSQNNNLKEGTGFVGVMGIIEFIAGLLFLIAAFINPALLATAISGILSGLVMMTVDDRLDQLETNNLSEEFSMVRETPRCGLIESLAVNEADTMIREGKEYDGDLCLAKAIMYVTITEAMDELGLMDVDQKKYSSIISAAGGSLNESRGVVNRINKGKATDSDLDKLFDGHYGEEVRALLSSKQSGKDAARLRAEGKVDEAKLHQKIGRYHKWDAQGAVIKAYQEREERRNLQRRNLRESVLVNQYVPVRNDISNGESLADRIRKKRLNEQSQILEERVSK